MTRSPRFHRRRLRTDGCGDSSRPSNKSHRRGRRTRHRWFRMLLRRSRQHNSCRNRLAIGPWEVSLANKGRRRKSTLPLQLQSLRGIQARSRARETWRTTIRGMRYLLDNSAVHIFERVSLSERTTEESANATHAIAFKSVCADASLHPKSRHSESSPASAAMTSPTATAYFGPRRSETAPDHRRETSAAANWAPETRPMTKAPKPRWS